MGVALGRLDQIAFLQLSKSAGIPQNKPLTQSLIENYQLANEMKMHILAQYMRMGYPWHPPGTSAHCHHSPTYAPTVLLNFALP
jgi:hypothetical protein